jgi:hypothetical protein
MDRTVMKNRVISLALLLAFTAPAAALEIKSDARPGARPSLTAPGEIAINRADGRLFYQDEAGNRASGLLPDLDASNYLRFRNGLTLGRWQDGKYIATPHILQIQSPGAPGTGAVVAAVGPLTGIPSYTGVSVNGTLNPVDMNGILGSPGDTNLYVNGKTSIQFQINNAGISAVGPTGFTGPAGGVSVTAPGASSPRTLADLAGFVAGNTPTIATLRTLPVAPLVSNVSVAISGYYAAADGGGGTFTWAPASTAADDGGSVIKPAGVSGAGRWVRVVNGPLSIRMFGAKGDGATNDGPSIRAAYLATTALGGRALRCPAGTFIIGSTVAPTSGVTFEGGRDCIVKSAGDGPAVLFDADGTSNVGFRGIKVDGTRANNPTNGQVAIHLRFAVNSFVRDCEFISIPSIAVAGYGDGQDFSSNDFHDVRDLAIVFYGFNNPSRNLTIKSNRVTGSMGHAINASFVDGFDISGNYARGTVIGQHNGLAVNVSGTTVTYAAGDRAFDGLLPGQFLVMGGGGEWQITSIVNDRTLTVAPNSVGNPPQGNGQTAMIGSGDFYGLDAVRNGIFSNNTGMDGATYGMGISSTSAFDSYNVTISGVLMVRTGKYGINVDGGGLGRTTSNISIVGSTLIDTGAGADAIDGGEKNAIVLTKNKGTIKDIFISGNVTSPANPSYGPTQYWLSVDPNMPAGSVFLGKNTSTTQFGNAILNDVKSIDLTGWGSTAKTDSVVSTGTQVSFRVVGSSGITALPAGTVNKITDSGKSPVVTGSIWSAGGNNVDTRYPIFTGGTAAGAWRFTFQTPTAPGADTALVLSLSSN